LVSRLVVWFIAAFAAWHFAGQIIDVSLRYAPLRLGAAMFLWWASSSILTFVAGIVFPHAVGAPLNYGLRYSLSLFAGVCGASIWLWAVLPSLNLPPSVVAQMNAKGLGDEPGQALVRIIMVATSLYLVFGVAAEELNPKLGFGPKDGRWWRWIAEKPLPRVGFAPLRIAFLFVYIAWLPAFVYFWFSAVFALVDSSWRKILVDLMLLSLPLLVVPLVLLWSPQAYTTAKELLSEHPRFRRWLVFGRGGSARWAGLRTYEKRRCDVFSYNVGDSGYSLPSVYLGRTLFDDTLKPVDVVVTDDAHLLTIGCTGSGKSTTTLWPNLALYRGSILILDPKGEHTRKTYWRRRTRDDFDVVREPSHEDLTSEIGARQREKQHKTQRRLVSANAFLLDPFKEVKEIPGHRFNPLAEIDITSQRVRALLSAISEACVLPEDPKNQHFVDMATLLLEGLIAHVLSTCPKSDQTLPFIADLVMGIDRTLGVADPGKLAELLIEMRTNGAAGGLPQLAASKLDEMGPNERGSVLSTLARSVKWITDPAMREHLSASDFKMSGLCHSTVAYSFTVYTVLPFIFMKEQARWMRTITNVALALIQSSSTKPEVPVLFILDEFPMLGRMKSIEEGVVTLRSAGVKLWPLVQNIGQLKSTFDANWETFVSSATVQLFGVNDKGTAQWASDLLDKNVQKKKEKKGFLSWGAGQEDSVSLATPGEIIEELGKARAMQYVFPTSGPPMRLKRMGYKTFEVEGEMFEGLPLEGHFEE
jgi:type IV secretion system protein VirD4